MLDTTMPELNLLAESDATDLRSALGLGAMSLALAACGGGSGDSPAAVTPPVTVPPPPVTPAPVAPTGLVARAASTQVVLTWTAQPQATSYEVRRSTISGGPYALIGSATTTSYTDTGLVNGQIYFYVVAAVNATATSAFSVEFQAIPAATSQDLGVPASVVVVAGTGQIQVSWSAVVGATGYQVKRSTRASGPFNLIAPTIGTNFLDGGLTGGVTYYYVVAATNAAGVGADSQPASAIPVATQPPPTPPVSAPVSDADAVRFLLQAQFSASEADITQVRTQGYKTWLTAQFSAPASAGGAAWLDARGYNLVDTTFRFFDNEYPADYMIWNQLITSSDAVRKRCALALSEFFVVSVTGLDASWRSHLIANWWDMLVAQTFGNYRSLLQAVTLNPAMGYYLNTKGNRKEDPARNRVPDENYGREVMQLFSIGLHQLNPDGTEKRDASGNRLDSYTQSDITNIARVFTGWDVDQSQNVPTSLLPAENRTIPSTHFTRLPMVLNANNHSALASSFLGASVPAGTAGGPALQIALDALFNHPNVAPFFGKQMIQRLVTSNPSAAYVARVAAAFTNNGQGVRGDLKAVFAAVLLDDEARGSGGLSNPGFGKLREPMLRFVQWARTFGMASARGSWKIGNLSNPGTQLGQSPLRSPSVFNYFRPGYVPPGTALSASKTPAPEFQLVHESGVSGYLNYLQNIVRNGIFVNAPDQAGNGSNSTNGFDITVNYSAELALVLDAPALVARLSLLLCAGQISAANQKLMSDALSATALTASSSDNAKRDRVAAAVLLVMASSEYLIQK
jgi:uncharacterized protein (DUF1800 family)